MTNAERYEKIAKLRADIKFYTSDPEYALHIEHCSRVIDNLERLIDETKKANPILGA